MTSSSHGWSIQSGRNESGCGSTFLDNLNCKQLTSPGDDTHDNDGHGHHAHDHRQTWTIQDWQHQGYQRILSRQESFSVHNRDVMDMFTYAPPVTDVAHPSTLLLAPVLPSTPGHRRGLIPALGDPTSPSSERHRTERETSRSPLVDARELSAWSSGCSVRPS